MPQTVPRRDHGLEKAVPTASDTECVLVPAGDVPLIQAALRAYSVSLRRMARGRGMSGPHNRTAREETRAEASRASQLAGQIGRR
jgi:hypothetical protein